MNHDQIEELIVLDLAGEASEEQSQRLAELVETDPDVAALYLESLEADQTISDFLSPSSVDEIPPVPHERLQQSMRANQPAAEPVANVASFPFMKVFAAAAAVALGVFILPKLMSPDGATEIEGYYVHSGGTSTLLRDGERSTVVTDTELIKGDRIELAAGSNGSLLGRDGLIPLAGPLQTSIKDAGVGRLSEHENPTLARALAGSIKELGGLISGESMPDPTSVEIHSPLEETFALRPVFSWFASEGKNYNVLVRDAATGETVISLEGVRPPVASPQQLKPRNSYRLEIVENGGALEPGSTDFRTPTPGNAVEIPDSEGQLKFAAGLLASHGKAGAPDALAALKSLPPEYALDELTLRLKLYSYHEMALDHRCQVMLQKLRELPKR